MLPYMVKLEIEYYKTGEDTSPFKEWFDNLEINATRKATAAISRMEEGNPGDVKFVGKGIWERRIFYDPGYRIYFGKDGNKVVILLTGGTNKAAIKGYCPGSRILDRLLQKKGDKGWP